MTPSFGAVFRATQAGESPAVLDTCADALREALRDSGAILVRGFDFDLAGFEAFCSLFGSRVVVHPGTALGGRVRVTESIATVDSGVRAFPWHAELSYTPQRPDLIGFACDRPSAKGGETFLTDGCAIADRLSEDGRAVATQRVRYRYVRAKEAWAITFDGAGSRADVERVLRNRASRLRPGDELGWRFSRLGERAVTIEFTTPILSSVRWSDRRAFCNHVIWHERRRRDHPSHPLDLRRFLWPPGGVALADGGRLPVEAVAEFERVADAEAYAIEWQKGDVAVVDNSRVMHARGDVLDASRRILARTFDAAF
jgi:alpha-ketoglutarate-dependent taurine dioxygenase